MRIRIDKIVFRDQSRMIVGKDDVSVFFIALNIVLANHLNVNCILFLNLSLWTVLHLVIDWLIARNRQKRESAFDKRF